MRTILRIVRDDLGHIRHNVIALIIILGLAIIPSMYAWFNIAASWDPYGNTGSLKVALANTDLGYRGDLLPLELNVGERIESALRENTDMDWVFTSEEDAIEGTRSGKYYAAFVIPQNFSADMMSLFSPEGTNPVIRYYSNEKENAISPKVTDKVAGALQQKIDETFVATASEVILNTFDTLSGYVDDGLAASFLEGLYDRLQSIEGNLVSSADTIQVFADLTDSLQRVLEATSDLLSQKDQAERTDRRKLADAAEQAENLAGALDGVSEQMDAALSAGADAYSGVRDQIEESFQSLSRDQAAVSRDLNGLADEIQTLIARYEGWRGELERLSEALPQGEVLLRGQLHQAILRLDRVIEKQQGLHDRLIAADRLLSDLEADHTQYQAELTQAAAAIQKDLDELRTDFNRDCKARLDDLAGKLTRAGEDGVKIQALLDKTAKDSMDLLTTGGGALEDIQDLLRDAAAELRAASEELDAWFDRIAAASDNQELAQVRDLLSQDPELLASLWASPVQVDTHLVYEIENYGSAMAPFYSTLSIWVGGVILVAMMQVMVSDEKVERLRQYGKVRHSELYFGRSLIFLLLGLIQTTILCLGDLLFLQIQCEHPFLFLLAGWVSSVVYVLLIYTLTISFGDVGKAAAVILLVIQVAGSGGTFPIEVAPPVFRTLYPLLPFVHTMTAMRECIAGMYQNTYWRELGILLVYLIPTLLLGLVLRRPIIRLNRFFEEKLAEVKFM